MANETKTEDNKQLLKAIAEGRVEQARVETDGTIVVPRLEEQLQSVDIADIDLVLGFTDGTFIIISNGALDAASNTPHNVVFNTSKDTLDHLFKLAGHSNPAKAGSLRVVTEHIDAARLIEEDAGRPTQEESDLPAPPAPIAKVSAGASLGKGPGKGPGMGGSGEGEGEVAATVTPTTTPQPPVYRVGKKSEVSVQDLLNGLGLGEQPNVVQTMYTSKEFKLTPSGRADLPLGSYDGNLTSAQLEQHASPEGQSTREVIYGTAAVDTIVHNAAFSSSEAQWSKTMHLTFNNFSEVTAIQIVVSATKLLLIPGFDIQGAGVTRTGPNSNTWLVTPSADIFGYGQDIQIVYNVSDSTVAPVDFGADIIVTGMTGPLNFEITNNIVFTWREATTESDFTVPSDSGNLMMVLPRAGLGVEIFAGDGNDTASAGAGHDLIHGQAGDDALYGGTGNDTLDGGLGSDHLDGGEGSNDTATYANATLGVTAVLDTYIATLLQNTNEAFDDTYEGIENLTGSNQSDILLGDAGINILTGSGGNDKLIGLGAADTLDGGDGTDTASYEYATNAISVSLTTNTGTQGEAAGDTLISIENLIGGSGNDTLTGASGIQANDFDGGAGTSDTVSYAPSLTGVVASLTNAFAHGTIPVNQTNDALYDTFTNIENLTGTFYDDTLIGDANTNILTGGRGNNVLEGMGGGDQLIGNIDVDTVSYDHSGGAVVASLTAGLVTQSGDAGGGAGATRWDDTYVSIENMIGSDFSDTLIGEDRNNIISGGLGDDILEGMGGSDTLQGGTGTDTASYEHANSYVYASLTTGLTGFVTEGNAAGDSYDSIENLTGSSFNDILIGDGSSNTITGGLGNDILEGMDGSDSLIGGDGSDSASYEHASSAVTASLNNPGDNLGDAAIHDSYSSIENLIGSAYADTLYGDGNDNILTGGAENDILVGNAGVDTLYGGTGNDSLSDDGIGEAKLYGNDGDDTITLTSQVSGGNNDTIDGGSGTDTLVWSYAGNSRMDVYMYGSQYAYFGGTGGYANLTGIENVTATGANSLYVFAGLGDNIIDGGTGLNDYVLYSNGNYTPRGIYANLSTGVVTGGSGNDTLIDIEHLYAGTYYDDVLIGNSANNWIRGVSGNDTIDGGDGIDTWYLDWNNTTGAKASLLTSTQNEAMGIVMSGDATGDTVTNMENIQAVYFDWIYGSQGDNNLYGRGLIEGFKGADVIRGYGTSATASYENAGNSYLVGEGISNAVPVEGYNIIATLTSGLSGYYTNTGTAVTNFGDAASDTYTNISNLYGSSFNDFLIGNGVINVLTGGAGNDLLEGLGAGDVFQGGAGNDTVSYAHSTAGILVDIFNNGDHTMTNDAFGDTFFSIENVTGSVHADTIYGDENDNILDGGLGNDVLDGAGGTNTASYINAPGAVTIHLDTMQVTGAAGADTLINIQRIIGSASGDSIFGTTGDDWLDGGGGADTIDGDTGSDTISYASATGPKSVVLGVANTDGDTLTNIENIYGTAFSDILTGDAGDNVIEGSLGNDTLTGGAHAGYGDTASYSTATAGVIVNLSSGSATGGAGNDTLSSFENLIGTAYADTLTGDINDNKLDGGSGNDILIGGVGADTMTGGAGFDTVSYADSSAGVTVTVNSSSNTGGDAAGDQLFGIENLIGSTHNDTLTGDGNSNLFDGGLGDDVMTGGAGTDTATYTLAASGVSVHLGDLGTNVSGGAGNDSLSQIENIIGSAHIDTLWGDGSNNVIEGGAGADNLLGGLGTDTASYDGSTGDMTVSLLTGTASDGDTLGGFENLLGGTHNDTLTGNTGANVLDGGAGDDTLMGGDGGDQLIGGAGTNTASYADTTATVAVTINLGGHATATTGGGFAVGDTFSGIQNLTGTNFNDFLYGDANANTLNGGGGSDRMEGYAGIDTFYATSGRDTVYGGTEDDIFYVDAAASLSNLTNLPTLVSGDGHRTGDTVILSNLVTGSYSLNSLASVTNSMEILDIRNTGANTSLNLTSADVRAFVDNGNTSEIWIKHDAGDSLIINLAGETPVTTTMTSNWTDYTILNSSGTQVAQIHWQTA